MLARAGRDSCLPQLCLHDRTFGDDASSLIVYVRGVPDDSYKLRLRTLTGGLVGDNSPVGYRYPDLCAAAVHAHSSLLKWPKRCLSRLRASFEGSLSAPGSLGSACGLSLVLTTMSLRHWMTRDAVSGFGILTVPRNVSPSPIFRDFMFRVTESLFDRGRS